MTTYKHSPSQSSINNHIDILPPTPSSHTIKYTQKLTYAQV